MSEQFVREVPPSVNTLACGFGAIMDDEDADWTVVAARLHAFLAGYYGKRPSDEADKILKADLINHSETGSVK